MWPVYNIKIKANNFNLKVVRKIETDFFIVIKTNSLI